MSKNNHRSGLTKELFKKMAEYIQIILQTTKIEDQSGLSEDELDKLFENEEYADLWKQKEYIYDDINRIAVDAKFFPLVNLTDIQKQLLDIYEGTIKPGKDTKKYTDIEFMLKRDDLERRLAQIKVLRLDGEVDQRIECLYREVLNCYKNGEYKGSAVLCRSITEFLIKDYINQHGYGNLLGVSLEQRKKQGLISILKKIPSKNKLIKQEIINLYWQIKQRAARILHEKEHETNESDALNSLKLLQQFRKKFSKFK